MNIALRCTLFFTAIVLCQPSLAGGPSTLEGPTGNTPVRYLNPNITINVETGTLGEFSNAEANIFASNALQLWNHVSTATINLSLNTTKINEDINVGNYRNYLNSDENLNILIYDTTGEIIEDLYGVEQSTLIAGIATSSYFSGGGYFIEGYAIINGKHPDTSHIDTLYTQLIAHEIAHFFGLDHSQVNIDNQESASGFPGICSTALPKNYPLMYPFLECRDIVDPHPDDIGAVSALYPTTDINDAFGIIEGRFVDESNNPILGANIWMNNLVSGETYSIVSDYLRQGTGYYKLYLPAGNYSLHANAINPIFYSGSSVGPYAASTDDLSFINPIADTSYEGDDTNSDGVITINTNQTTTVNFSSIGSSVTIPKTDVVENDSISDFFGATSPFMLMLLFAPLVLRWQLSRSKKRL